MQFNSICLNFGLHIWIFDIFCLIGGCCLGECAEFFWGLEGLPDKKQKYICGWPLQMGPFPPAAFGLFLSIDIIRMQRRNGDTGPPWPACPPTRFLQTPTRGGQTHPLTCNSGSGGGCTAKCEKNCFFQSHLQPQTGGVVLWWRASF